MGEYTEAFIGIDAAKARNAVAVAEGGRGGEVRYLGEVDASEPGFPRWIGVLPGPRTDFRCEVNFLR